MLLMFLSCHVRVLEWIYTRQLPECQGNSLLEKGAKFKWQQRDSKFGAECLSVHLRTKWFWVRISLLSHNKCEKIFRSMAGIILCSIELYFFSILLKIMTLLPWTEKNDSLEAFTGISFSNVHEILLCKFSLTSMKSIEM